MLTVGGAISGYSEIGSARSTSRPAIVMMIDSTAAKIGLSMKKCEKRMPLFRGELATGWVDLSLSGGDGHAGPHERVRQAANHHVIGRRQAGGHDAEASRH